MRRMPGGPTASFTALWPNRWAFGRRPRWIGRDAGWGLNCLWAGQLKVIHTPGHTSGGICLYGRNNLFTGDTLFVGAVGRTDPPGGSLETLLQSLKDKIITLPDETVVRPAIKSRRSTDFNHREGEKGESLHKILAKSKNITG